MGCSFSNSDTTISAQVCQDFKNPHQNNNSSNLSSKGNPEILDLERMRTLLTEYMATEESIQSLELTNPVTVFYVKKSQLDQIDIKIQEQLALAESLKGILRMKHDTRLGGSGRRLNSSSSFQSVNSAVCKKKTHPHPTVLDVLENIGDKKFSRDEQEFLTATNKLEIAVTELEMLYQEKVLHGNDVSTLFDTLSKLSDKYKKQDSILEQLGIDDGFNEDAKEESELIELESHRITISETHERWKEARTQLLQISAQFSMVLTNLEESATHPSLEVPFVSFNGRGQYEIGEEVRDRLVSILQGLNNVKFLIQIKLPYCADSELSVLQRALTYLFIDLRTDERTKHATECYSAFQGRTLALLVWIDKTIEIVIAPALQSKTAEIQNKIQILSQVRLIKICKQFPDLYGKSRQFPNSSSPERKETQKVKEKYEFTLWNQLDPLSKSILGQLNFKLLAKLPKSAQLFDGENKITMMQSVKETPAKAEPIVNVKDRTNRFTRKASMDNLTQMLGKINSNLGDSSDNKK